MTDDQRRKQLEFTAGMLEREANVKRESAEAIRAAVEENDRLRDVNVGLFEACVAARDRLRGFGDSYSFRTIEQLDAAIDYARRAATEKGES